MFVRFTLNRHLVRKWLLHRASLPIAEEVVVVTGQVVVVQRLVQITRKFLNCSHLITLRRWRIAWLTVIS